MDCVVKLAVEPKFEILDKQIKTIQIQIKDINQLLIEIKKNQDNMHNKFRQFMLIVQIVQVLIVIIMISTD
jgi:hypothetical protein